MDIEGEDRRQQDDSNSKNRNEDKKGEEEGRDELGSTNDSTVTGKEVEEELLEEDRDQEASSVDTDVTSNTTNDIKAVLTMKQRLHKISLEVDQQNNQYRRILQHPTFPSDDETSNSRTDHPKSSNEPRSSSDEESLDEVGGSCLLVRLSRRDRTLSGHSRWS